MTDNFPSLAVDTGRAEPDWKQTCATVIHAFDAQRNDLDAVLRLDEDNPIQALYDAKQIVRKLLRAPTFDHDEHGQCFACGHRTDDTETVLSLRQTLARYATRNVVSNA